MGQMSSILHKMSTENGLGTAVTGGRLSNELPQSTFLVECSQGETAHYEYIAKSNKRQIYQKMLLMHL